MECAHSMKINLSFFFFFLYKDFFANLFARGKEERIKKFGFGKIRVIKITDNLMPI